ncbi:MAG: orotidine-5'-phosphate decarboxylase [Candidatus Omnitrophica bacterium]|nr:orotidine-5'-phosphate decarboxylase [Candidatus Omnitrophota bacterium]
MKDRLIVALDTATLNEAEALVDKLYPLVKLYKIGSQLFCAKGPDAVRAINKKGARVFLDLKFHDIPNTVSKAIEAAAGLNPFMLNIHASGGAEMIKSAAAAMKLLPQKTRPALLAVTVLTSIDKKALKQLGITRSPAKQVVYLAKLAQQNGADGVVCSPAEVKEVRKSCGRDFIIVTPGIRSGTDKKFDQKRTAAPKEAIENGADYIVVGRPVTAAVDPKKAAEEIIRQWMC